MKKWLLLLFLTSSLLAKEENKTIKDQSFHIKDQKEAKDSPYLHSTRYSIAPKVNPITGEYCEEAVDLVIAGAESLSLRRFYHSLSPDDRRFGQWRFNPETFLLSDLEYDQEKLFATIGERDGSLSVLSPSDNKNHFHFVPTNKLLLGCLDGRSHPAHVKLDFQRINDPKVKRRFQYVGTIVDGSGKKRTFASPMHLWLDRVTDVEYTHFLGIKIKHKSTYYPNTWTPFELPILEETLPNGNILCYTYSQWKKEKEGFPYPQLIGSITAYNATKTKIMGSIQFEYKIYGDGDIDIAYARGSDGRAASFRIARGNVKRYVADSPNQAHMEYLMPYMLGDKGLIEEITKPNGSSFVIKYDEERRVSAECAPVGPNGEMVPIGSYEYFINKTQVTDAEGNITEYHTDENKCLKEIKILKDKRLYQTTQFTWDPGTRNLLRKVIANGEGRWIHVTEYKYDKNHNPIEEKVGLDNEWRTVKRTYSDDGYNLKLSESDRPGKVIRYSYLPGKNLLTSELTFEGAHIRKRVFHFYDDCAICIKSIVDDGSTREHESLVGVTYRKITHILPKQSMPCFGLPEIVEEKTINKQGEEILLHGVKYHYAPSGQVVQEEHYDAIGHTRYSMYYSYDHKERLISKTDPMGAVTCYEYDQNHNLITILGPLPKQRSEIAYDRADRPIRMTYWHEEGKSNVHEKKYNKLGEVIEEIDEAKQKKRMEYDRMGNITAIHHPNGAVERKEYDALGNLIVEIDPAGEQTIRKYNLFHQPISVFYSDGTQEGFTYHATGTMASHLDRNGATTLYTYDLFDHLIKEEVYSSKGELLKLKEATWTPFNKISEYEGDLAISYLYDFAGRILCEQKDYKKTEYSYDLLGDVAFIRNGQCVEKREYDFCHRVTKISHLYRNKVQKEIEYQYDGAGNCTLTKTGKRECKNGFYPDGPALFTIDPLGNKTHYKYQYTPLLCKTTINPKGILTQVYYDALGRESMVCKKNQKGEFLQRAEVVYNIKGLPIERRLAHFLGTAPIKVVTHRLEYGLGGKLIRFVEAGKKETKYHYDCKGRLQTTTKPDGAKLHRVYDDLGRLIRHHGKDFDDHYVYDARDRLLMVMDKKRGCKTIRSYDSLSNVVKEDLANGLSCSYQLDNEGRRRECTLSDGSKIEYEYEGIFLYSVLRKGYQHIYAEREKTGEVAGALSPVGAFSYKRNVAGGVLSMEGPYYKASSFQYDKVGNLLRYDERGNTHRYQYDDLDQLVEEDGVTYRCDSLHNRLYEGDNKYTVDHLNQVVSDGRKNYSYDLCGNLVSDGESRYSYDSLDRLVGVERGDLRVEYVYDAFHRRLSKTLFRGGMLEKKVRYLWDGNHEIGCVDERGRMIELRVLGEGLGAEVGSAVLYELGGVSYVPVHDHRGCVVALVDVQSEELVDAYSYSAFKEEGVGQGISPWRFSSKRVDEESGFVYFGRRYYQPGLGRWITQDPQGFGDGYNLYAYLHHSPMLSVDLYGLEGRMVGMARSAFSFMEWVGANLIPGPALRYSMERVGRAGSGGDLHGASRYRTPRDEIITIAGIEIPGVTFTYGNGIRTKREEAIEQAKYISEKNGNVQVVLLYNGTDGLAKDLHVCVTARSGSYNGYNKMCAGYFRNKLEQDPNHRFISVAHSRGGIQIRNIGKLLHDEERKHIFLTTYGSGVLIRDGYFGKVTNVTSRPELITWIGDPINSALARINPERYNLTVLPSETHNPLKAHGLLEKTYADEIKRRGDTFISEYVR